MTKKIFRSICLAAIAVLLASLVLIMGVLYDYFAQLQRRQLAVQTDLAAQGLMAQGMEYFDGLQLADCRLTWIAADGAVLYDSASTGDLGPLLSRIALQQEQLRRDKEQLEKNEQIRREFTANVSHELKTPLHSISGYAELLANGMVQPQDVENFAGKIYSESQRMSSLVEDVIALSRLDDGAPEMQREECDL